MIFTYILGIILGKMFCQIKIKKLKKEYSAIIQELEFENTSLRIENEEIKNDEKLSYEEQLFYD